MTKKIISINLIVFFMLLIFPFSVNANNSISVNSNQNLIAEVPQQDDMGDGGEGGGGSSEAPRHLLEFERIFVTILIMAWGLSILYFTVRVTIIGAQYMFSMGDSSKTSDLKSQGGAVVVAMVIVFGSYVFVRTIMLILSLKSPGGCVGGGTLAEPTFKFFFPEACGV